VKHVRDLLKPSDWADAYGGTDCASLSFLNAVSGGELSGKKRVVDCTPPDCIMPGATNPLLLGQLHPLNKDQKPISCLKVGGLETETILSSLREDEDNSSLGLVSLRCSLPRDGTLHQATVSSTET
jgi:hypothetical protein